ncbi:hypothetical protein CY35_11G057800 [Sphagnum magellanicum]|nr:hypothetical protein CY35_11G057800 [Sphagnum magellanicum]
MRETGRGGDGGGGMPGDYSSYRGISKKWVGLVTAIWVQAISGNNYTFANYSAALKTVMQYNQKQLNSLGVAKDVGKSFGLLAGFLADYLPTWAILLIGAIEGFLGYGAQYLVVSQRISPLPFWQMALALCFGGNSTTWMNTAVLVTCMRNFPRSRGNVTGILKGYVGLSTAIFTELCTSLFTSEASAFLLLLTFLPAIVCLVAIAFLSEVPPSSTKEEDTLEYSNFTILNSISMALAFYLLTFTLIGKFFVISSFANKLFAGVLLLFLVAPLVVPIQLLYSKYMRNRSSAAQQSQGDKMRIPLLLEDDQQKDELQEGGEPTATTHQPIFENLENGEEESMRAEHPEQCVTMDDVPSIVTPPHPPLDDQMFLANQVLERDSEVGKRRKRHAPVTAAPGGEEDHHHTLVDGGFEGSGKKWRVPPALGEDHTLLEALQTIDFWLLFFTFLCGVGTGITAINNLGQIGQAQGYSDVSLFISFISIWGFFGRIGAGAISEYYVRKAAVPRPVWMVLSQLLMLVGYILFATATPGSLYVGSIVVGICYGVQISITVPTASELFGLQHFGIMYNFIILNLPLGSFLFSGLLAGWLYDQEASRTPQQGHGKNWVLMKSIGTSSKEFFFSSVVSEWGSSSAEEPQNCTGTLLDSI